MDLCDRCIKSVALFIVECDSSAASQLVEEISASELRRRQLHLVPTDSGTSALQQLVQLLEADKHCSTSISPLQLQHLQEDQVVTFKCGHHFLETDFNVSSPAIFFTALILLNFVIFSLFFRDSCLSNNYIYRKHLNKCATFCSRNKII